jgi:hypothetical protein
MQNFKHPYKGIDFYILSDYAVLRASSTLNTDSFTFKVLRPMDNKNDRYLFLKNLRQLRAQIKKKFHFLSI